MSKPIQWRQCPTLADMCREKFVVAFLQARMGSTRLPGKALLKIQGQSILERAVRRLRAASIIHDIAVLTTTLVEDDALVNEARRLGVRIHRGPERDVLARFQEAAERFRPDVIVRATADNPLIEIGSVERIVCALLLEQADWCMEVELPYGAATEALTASALARAHQRAWEACGREHVTLYIKQHPEEFHSILLFPPQSLRHPQIRLTVDTPEDLVFMDELIRRLPEGTHPLPMIDYLTFASTAKLERV